MGPWSEPGTGSSGPSGVRGTCARTPEGTALGDGSRDTVPADLAVSLAEGSKVGTPLWNPPVVAVAEVRDAVGAAIVTSIQGGNVKAAADKAAADMKRIMAETEK